MRSAHCIGDEVFGGVAIMAMPGVEIRLQYEGGYIHNSFEKALRKNGVETEIKLSALKEDAAIIGSARMIDPEYWEKIRPILPKM